MRAARRDLATSFDSDGIGVARSAMESALITIRIGIPIDRLHTHCNDGVHTLASHADDAQRRNAFAL